MDNRQFTWAELCRLQLTGYYPEWYKAQTLPTKSESESESESESKAKAKTEAKPKPVNVQPTNEI